MSGLFPFRVVALLKSSSPAAVFTAAAILLAVLGLDMGILGPKSKGLALEEVAE